MMEMVCTSEWNVDFCWSSLNWTLKMGAAYHMEIIVKLSLRRIKWALSIFKAPDRSGGRKKRPENLSQAWAFFPWAGTHRIPGYSDQKGHTLLWGESGLSPPPGVCRPQFPALRMRKSSLLLQWVHHVPDTSAFSPFNFSEAPTYQKRSLPWNCYLDERDICRPATVAVFAVRSRISAQLPNNAHTCSRGTVAWMEKYSSQQGVEGKEANRWLKIHHTLLCVQSTVSKHPPNTDCHPHFRDEGTSSERGCNILPRHKVEK